MLIPTTSLILARRYVTELIRSPRATAALGGRRRPALTPATRPAPRPAAA